ncbi:hypothetical protein SRABI83_02330 [Arthrobacter sp. Bi83]|nr:hypothetical protein SRABI83_02330 [Arthrobacter sp. Bi83]
MRTVGQRRRDAEEKLEHHLQEARHKDDPHHDDDGDHDHANDARHDGDAGQEAAGAVDSRDVAAIQNDDRLTAADRVDLIANQALSEGQDAEQSQEPDGTT